MGRNERKGIIIPYALLLWLKLCRALRLVASYGLFLVLMCPTLKTLFLIGTLLMLKLLHFSVTKYNKGKMGNHVGLFYDLLCSMEVVTYAGGSKNWHRYCSLYSKCCFTVV